MTGQRVVRCGVVVFHVVVHGADQGHLVHHLGQPRQMFADGNPIGLGRNRLVRPANGLGRIRLHIEHVDMTRPAKLVEENHRLRPGLGRVSGCDFEVLGIFSPEQLRYGQSQQAEPADLQGVSPGQPSRVKPGASEGMF